MKLSKYVLKIPYKSKIILYNTVNDMIVLCDYKDFLNKKSKEILKANGFFDNDNELLQKYMKQIFKYLSKQDINDIEKTIESEELKTSSEICVVIKYKIPAVYKNLQKYALHLFKQYKIFKTKNRNKRY